MERDGVTGGAGDGEGAAADSDVFWIVYSAAWAVFLLGYSVMLLLLSDRTVLQSVGPASGFTLPAALLGVGVVHLARRWRWPPESPVRFSVLHLTSASLYSLTWGLALSLVMGLQRVLLGGGPFEMPSLDNTIIALHLLFGFVVYGAIAGGTYLARMGRRLRAERERAVRAEALRARAQFRALRARLNPHFLFNSLHSVLSLIGRAPDRAERAVERLAELLRYAVGSGPAAEDRGGPDQVTLGRELEMVRSYLELEKIRLGDRLEVEEDVTGEAAAVHVPPLTVQPLVENAVQHGIGESTEGGTVRLAARVESDGELRRLRVRVRDDGPGADPEEIASSDGVGLSLVRRRLQLLYGGDARLNLDSAPGDGFEARVDAPADAAPRSSPGGGGP